MQSILNMFLVNMITKEEVNYEFKYLLLNFSIIKNIELIILNLINFTILQFLLLSRFDASLLLQIILQQSQIKLPSHFQ